MADGLTVPFQELGVREGDSPTASGDLETTTVNRKLLVDWLHWPQAYYQLLGYSRSNEGSLKRYLPQEDFEHSNLWCNRISRVSGIGWRDKIEAAEVGDPPESPGSTNKYAKALIECEFGPRPYNLLSDDEIESADGNEFLRFVEANDTAAQGEYLTLPTLGVLKWSEGPNHDSGTPANSKPFPGNVGKIVVQSAYTFRHHQVPDDWLPEEAILACIGRSNDADFGDPDNPRLYFPVGTLLLNAVEWRRTYSPYEREPQWTISYQLLYAPNTWHKFVDFKAVPPAYYQVTSDGVYYAPGTIGDAGKTVYGEADYQQLFLHV